MRFSDFGNSALNEIPEVICALDDSGNILAVNKACFPKWGYHPDELVGQPFLEYIAPQLVSETANALKDATNCSAESFCFETKVICKDAAELYVLWTGVWSKLENALFLVSCHHSKIREANDEIKASEARIRTIINHLILGLVIVNERGYIESMNPRAEALFNFKAEQVVAKPVSVLFEAQSRKLDETLFLEAIISSTLNRRCDIACVRGNGDRFAATVFMNELRTHEGIRYLLHVLDKSPDVVTFPLDQHEG